MLNTNCKKCGKYTKGNYIGLNVSRKDVYEPVECFVTLEKYLFNTFEQHEDIDKITHPD